MHALPPYHPSFHLSVCGMTNSIPCIRLQTHIWLIRAVFVQKKIKCSRNTKCRLIILWTWSYMQLTVEPHPLQSMGSCCSLTPSQQKAQWWCSSVTQSLSQRERWQQRVGGMVSGPPTQEVSPAALDQHPHPHNYLWRHPYWLQVLRQDLVRVNFCSFYNIQCKHTCISTPSVS